MPRLTRFAYCFFPTLASPIFSGNYDDPDMDDRAPALGLLEGRPACSQPLGLSLHSRESRPASAKPLIEARAAGPLPPSIHPPTSLWGWMDGRTAGIRSPQWSAIVGDRRPMRFQESPVVPLVIVWDDVRRYPALTYCSESTLSRKLSTRCFSKVAALSL